MLIDSHCHLDRLDLSEREGGLEAVIADAQARGISHLLTVAVDLESSKSLTENIYQKINKLEIGDISDPINKDKSIVFLKLNNKKISKIESLDLAKLKKKFN